MKFQMSWASACSALLGHCSMWLRFLKQLNYQLLLQLLSCWPTAISQPDDSYTISSTSAVVLVGQQDRKLEKGVLFGDAKTMSEKGNPTTAIPTAQRTA
jgi:hypothetical protein